MSRTQLPTPGRHIARLRLARVARSVPTVGGTAWSRGLWGRFLPERRLAAQALPDGATDRRRPGR